METTRPVRWCQDDGQVTILAALGFVVIAALMLAVIELGNRAVRHAQAQTAADAAALAAVSVPNTAAFSEAERIARANGATVTVTMVGDMARADVEREGARASAQAKAGRREVQGLIPAMSAALVRAEQLLGGPIVIVSGFRSRSDQERLWANRHTNPYPVAVPGTSNHELGRAVDVPSFQAPLLASVADQVGLCQPLPVADSIHFIWCG